MNFTGIVYIVEFLTKGMLRTAFWCAMFIGLGVLAILLNTISPSIISSSNKIELVESLLSSKPYICILIISLFSVPVDLFNIIPDTLQGRFIKFLTRIKFIGKHFVAIHLAKSRNTAVMSFHDIDAFISHFYMLNKGNIYLFNPPNELLFGGTEYLPIIHSIRKNLGNIQKLVLILPKYDDQLHTKEKISSSMGLADSSRLTLVTKPSEELMPYSESYVAGVYTGAHPIFKNRGAEIQYFLHRPLYQPYNEKFTIVQSKKSMKSVKYPRGVIGEENLNSHLERFIESINDMEAV